jgi:hypothetical protein
LRPYTFIDSTFSPCAGRGKEKRGKDGETGNVCCTWTIDPDACARNSESFDHPGPWLAHPVRVGATDRRALGDLGPRSSAAINALRLDGRQRSRQITEQFDRHIARVLTLGAAVGVTNYKPLVSRYMSGRPVVVTKRVAGGSRHAAALKLPLLRPCREQPRGCAADKCDELAPSHP